VTRFVVCQERCKALGYIESNVSAAAELKPLDDREADRAPDNVNQLHITVVQCTDVMSRRKGNVWVVSSLAAAAAAAGRGVHCLCTHQSLHCGNS